MDPFNSMVQNLVNNSSSLAHAPQVNTSSGLGYTDPGHGFMTNARVFDFDSDSKGAEGSEDPSDSAPRRSAKRTRAAEVHNMSEKRRRSRINEKMKALQKLIPNSNKTDKASMLDEAIEYLKQLQLQVQMLSMRNGVSLYPYCSPGPEPGIAALEHGLLTSRGDVFSLSTDTFNQCPQSTQPNLLFPLTETSIRPNFQTLNQLASSKDICQLSQLHLDMKCSGKNSTSGVSS